jgi:diaminopropionate ammonia-lyase
MRSSRAVRWAVNEKVERSGWPQEDLSGDPRGLHRRLPGYRVTPLRSLDGFAGRLGVREVLVKDESERLGLPAFKILGSSWAVYKSIERELLLQHGQVEPWAGIEELKERAETAGARELVTASDGNHGRGVAHAARWLDWPATVFMPHGTAGARVTAIEEEGAEVAVVEGNHDAAVKVAADYAEESPERWLIQDTSWPGYTQVPGWIVEGYDTLMQELEEQLAERQRGWPDLVLVPFGTGALAGAVIRHLRRPGGPHPALVTVEPVGADCALESIRARKAVSIPGHSGTVMAGLNCNSVASILLDPLLRGVDGAVSLGDQWAAGAVRELSGAGLVSGESGASGAAGLMALASDPELATLRGHLGIGPDSSVLLLNTEGITDPEVHRRILQES